MIHNEGLIKDSSLQVSANIENANPTNCYFSGFAGINDGNIENCKASPNIKSKKYLSLPFKAMVTICISL